MEAFEQLRASAVQAAMAAQTLATTGFDDMAAADDYVQSEGFNNNVAVTAAAALPLQNKDRQLPHVLDDENDDDDGGDASTLSTNSSTRPFLNRLPPLRPESPLHSSLRNSATTLVPLKVNVPVTEQLYQLSRFSNDDDLDDDDQDDPILSLVRKQQQSARGQQSTHSDEAEGEATPLANRNTKKNRFMDDLEMRLALPAPDLPPPASRSGPPRGTGAADDERPTLSAWLSATVEASMARGQQLLLLPPTHAAKKAPTARLNHASSAPLARHKQRRVPRGDGAGDDGDGSSTTNYDDDDGAVRVVSSAALLGDAERSELALLRRQQEQSAHCAASPLRLARTALQRHPREAFTAATLLLGIFLYFYRNNRFLEA